MKNRPEIDGLRAIAVIPVILFHAGSSLFGGGFVGVDVFFVISGYLITTIIIDELDGGSFSLVDFYQRRARRILPALFFVMIVCIPFAYYWLLPGEMRDFSRSIVAVSVFLSNVFFWRDAGYFDTVSELKPLLHTWSLAVEGQFYILFPIFLIFVWRFGRRAVIGGLILIAIASLLLANWASLDGRAGSFFLLPTRGWELLIGGLTAFYVKKRGLINSFLASQIMSLVGFCCIAFSMLYFNKNTPFPSLYGLVPTLGTALIILTVSNRTLLGVLLGSKAIVSVGLISYSAYLWHQPILAFARQKDLYSPTFSFITIVIVGTLLLSYFSWRYIECYFRRGERVSKKAVLKLSVTGTIAFACIGALGSITDGFIHRVPPDDRYLAGLRHSDMGRYVDKRFIEANLKEFDAEDRKRKILIVGDSFSKDLVNAVFESSLKNYYQISTYYISGGCGNLYTERDLTKHITDVYRPVCKKTNWFNNEKLKRVMREADEIWLSSNWQLWVAELLPESIANLERDFGKRVVVFGSKRFGEISIKKILATAHDERSNLSNTFQDEFLRVNEFMRSTIHSSKFIDVSYLLCSSDSLCRMLTLKGDLISFDGTHLTPEGAKFMGEALSGHPLMYSDPVQIIRP